MWLYSALLLIPILLHQTPDQYELLQKKTDSLKGTEQTETSTASVGLKKREEMLFTLLNVYCVSCSPSHTKKSS